MADLEAIERKIAQKQDEINRLRAKQRKLETGQKVVIGGMMLAVAEKDPEIAAYLLEQIEEFVTRVPDIERLKPVKKDLEEWSKRPRLQTEPQEY